jgi:hypothetical protein
LAPQRRCYDRGDVVVDAVVVDAVDAVFVGVAQFVVVLIVGSSTALL